MTHSVEQLDSIKSFIDSVERYIEERIKSGLKPVQQKCFRWKINTQDQATNSPVKPSATGREFTKDSYRRPFLDLLFEIEKTSEYKALLASLKKLYPSENIEGHYLRLFTYHLLEIVAIEYEGCKKRDRARISSRFLDDINGLPATYTVVAYMDGVYIESERIVCDLPNLSLTIRKTTIEDQEVELKTDSREDPFKGLFRSFSPDPSSILEIAYEANDYYEAEVKLCEVVTMLRLFGVGAVNYFCYKIYTDSMCVNGPGPVPEYAFPSYVDHGRKRVSSSYIIQTKRDNEFKEFVDLIYPKLSLFTTYKEGKEYIKISFDKYILAANRDGIVEEGTANAVAGLEALLLENESELSYKFRLLGATLLSFFNANNSGDIEDILKNAYNIRSKFVHGSILTPKDKKKICEKYDSIETIRDSCLTYLREAIVVLAILSDCVNKKDLRKLIEEHVRDKVAESGLDALMGKVPSILKE